MLTRTGLGLGLAFGILAGIILKNTILAVIVGLAFALVVGAVSKRRPL
jgi:hypothetical protein